ncbi:MAG: DNA methyltransferase [Sedimentisphaerales bacterium]|jgi:DNA modification methylase
MAKKPASNSKKPQTAAKPSSLVDTRVIYCGDNLEQLKKLPDECVDLIYIDPPFNSNRNYEVFWGETKEKRAFEDRHASTQAYIDFMRPRCVELHRVLKKTGSFYYHCDWHASHYVKIMLDQIFSENQFVNEIVWKRSSNRSSMSKIFRRAHDSIFFYTKNSDYLFNMQYKELSEGSLENYKHEDEKGRYRYVPLLVSGKRNGETGKLWKGIDPNHYGKAGMHWVTIPDKLDEYDSKGLIYWPEKGGLPTLKYYLEDNKGVPLSDVWDDIDLISSSSRESLGYPTQKPLALLDRIIEASSNPNDIVLDAFCGCGTALVAAENLGRQWIGIDVSPTACRVMAKRLRDVCKMKEDETLWRNGRGFVVRDLPWTIEKLREIPPFEFENWAVIALGGIPNVAKVGDMGIDGRIYPVSATPKKDKGELGFMDVWYPIQVKQKDKVGRPDIDSFEAVMTREDRTKGFFVAFDYSSDAMSEIQAFFKKSGKSIIALTVKDILDEQIAYKLA